MITQIFTPIGYGKTKKQLKKLPNGQTIEIYLKQIMLQSN
jgi:TusA-related sulfurtransferase